MVDCLVAVTRLKDKQSSFHSQFCLFSIYFQMIVFHVVSLGDWTTAFWLPSLSRLLSCYSPVNSGELAVSRVSSSSMKKQSLLLDILRRQLVPFLKSFLYLIGTFSDLHHIFPPCITAVLANTEVMSQFLIGRCSLKFIGSTFLLFFRRANVTPCWRHLSSWMVSLQEKQVGWLYSKIIKLNENLDVKHSKCNT